MLWWWWCEIYHDLGGDDDDDDDDDQQLWIDQSSMANVMNLCYGVIWYHNIMVLNRGDGRGTLYSWCS